MPEATTVEEQTPAQKAAATRARNKAAAEQAAAETAPSSDTDAQPGDGHSPGSAPEVTPEQAQAAVDATDIERQPRNVVEAVIEVMRLVRAVGKDGRNEQQNFNFRGIDGVLNAVGPALRKVGVLCIPAGYTLESGEIEVGNGDRRRPIAHQVLKATYKYLYSDADGEITELDVHVVGESMDSGDKSISKAFSVAYRTALIQSLSLPTTDRDPDQDTYERAPSRPPLEVSEVVAALDRAVADNPGDPLATRSAIIAVGNHYGVERLAGIEIADRSGEVKAGDVMIRDMIAHFGQLAREQHEAAEAAKHQQQAGEESQDPADTPPVEQPAADVSTEQAPAEQPRAEEPAAKVAADAAVADAQANDPRAVMYERARAEAMAYAEILGVKSKDFMAPLFHDNGTEDITQIPTHGPKGLQTYLVRQRQRVTNALFDKRRVDEGHALAAAGDRWPLTLEQLFGTTRQHAGDAPEQESAQQ